MPYIKKEDQKKFTDLLKQVDEFFKDNDLSPGELNYFLSRILILYYKNYSKYNGLSYALLNSIIGVIENVKLEFYRRVITPYEDKKKKNNDIYRR